MLIAIHRRHRPVGALVLGLLLFVASLVAFVHGAPDASAGLPSLYVVDPSGDDAGPGTDAQPWRTLGAALDRLHPGSILLVRNGVYTGPLAIRKQASAEAPILVSAYPGHRPVIRSSQWQGLLVENASYVHVRGFEVIGNAQTARASEAGLEIVNSHHVRFDINVVHDFGGGGISAVHSNHVSIENNEVYNTSWWAENQTSAISLWQMQNIGGGNNADGYSNYINANYVHDNENRVGAITDGNCIILDSNDQTGYTASTFITNNVCRANGGRGIHFAWSSNAAVINNTVFDNVRNLPTNGAELSAIYAKNVLFRNNLVAPRRAGSGIMVYDSSNVSTDHNAYVDSSAQVLGPNDKLVPGLPRMFGVFPPIEGPTTDAGNADRAPALDFIGRPHSGRPDIGAFELR